MSVGLGARSFAPMATTEDPTSHAGTYVDAGGVHTYYEVTGTGEPLVLLHGGLCTAETWGAQTPALAEHYRVYVPERRAHGRTPDVDGPITYDVMAKDTIAFMDAVGIPSARIVGWSDGALVGLLVALERPDLVAKLVLIGQFINFDGALPENHELMELASPEVFPPSFEQAYAAVSPDGPEHYRVVFDKLIKMWRADPGIAVSRLANVTAPTLVLLGDDDILTNEHALAMHEALPESQLAIVPGASHALPLERPELTNRLLLDFLADEQAPKLFPLREMLAHFKAAQP
jgi:pimeloyl-ACP methyl ester carboxylesterase